MITANNHRKMYKMHNGGDSFQSSSGGGFFLKSDFLKSISLSDLNLDWNDFELDIENNEFAKKPCFDTYYFYSRNHIGYMLSKIVGKHLIQSDIDFLLYSIKCTTNSHCCDGETFSKPLHDYIHKREYDGATYIFGDGSTKQLDRYKSIPTFGYRRFNNYIKRFELPFKASEYKDEDGKKYWIIKRT